MAAAKTSNHAHDKTMLAKLGFADQDRRSELHDLACQFLMQEHVALKLAKAFLLDEQKDEEFTFHLKKVGIVPTAKMWNVLDVKPREYTEDVPGTRKFNSFTLKATSGEMVISKGLGNYQTTIGFIDVALGFGVTQEGWIESGSIGLIDGRRCRAIAIEVKAGRTQVSDVIRQISLYRQYPFKEIGNWSFRTHVWLMASTWDVTATEKTALKREGIGHVLLGDSFNQFVDASRNAPSAQSDLVF